MERRRCEQPKPAERPHIVRAEPPKVYTVEEVADLLKVSQGTVRNMISEGQLHGIRLHVRRLVVPKWSVDDLLARPAGQHNVTPLHRPASNE
jgi:excisionase family DNA binding protein